MHEVELKPHRWIFVQQLMGLMGIPSQICYYFGGACGYAPGRVGHGHMHHEALIKIIILIAVILPVNNDILYKYMIAYSHHRRK